MKKVLLLICLVGMSMSAFAQEEKPEASKPASLSNIYNGTRDSLPFLRTASRNRPRGPHRIPFQNKAQALWCKGSPNDNTEAHP